MATAKKDASKKKPLKPSNKVFQRAKGKLGSLTFSDINNLTKLLNNYKGEVPEGYSRKHCQACVIKSN